MRGLGYLSEVLRVGHLLMSAATMSVLLTEPRPPPPGAVAPAWPATR